MEGSHRYLNLEGNSHLRVRDRSGSEDICLPWWGKKAKVEVFLLKTNGNLSLKRRIDGQLSGAVMSLPSTAALYR